MGKIKLRCEDVSYDMAVPANKADILMWLITGGRKGRLFVRKSKGFRRWITADDINCRCVMKVTDN